MYARRENRSLQRHAFTGGLPSAIDLVKPVNAALAAAVLLLPELVPFAPPLIGGYVYPMRPKPHGFAHCPRTRVAAHVKHGGSGKTIDQTWVPLICLPILSTVHRVG